MWISFSAPKVSFEERTASKVFDSCPNFMQSFIAFKESFTFTASFTFAASFTFMVSFAFNSSCTISSIAFVPFPSYLNTSYEKF